MRAEKACGARDTMWAGEHGGEFTGRLHERWESKSPRLAKGRETWGTHFRTVKGKVKIPTLRRKDARRVGPPFPVLSPRRDFR